MFTKSLAAIYFSGNKVLVTELDSNKKKIKKNVLVELSEGIINSNKIVDKKRLTESLKELWNSNSIKNKDVGLVIPEFSTFTKLITLPKLAASEIGEAVDFEAQEYLPTGVENMVLDWKVLEKTNSGVEVLMVAIPKNTLMDYVDACVDAGLYPAVVVTPSILVGNIVKCDAGFVAILVEPDQTIIITGEKNKIYTTNVIGSKDVNGIMSSVSKIIKHFSKIQFKNYFVGGENMNTGIIESLKSNFKAEVSILSPGVDGDLNIIQKHLVPLALLKSPVAEPSDPRTLNLLPSNLVEKYQKQKARVQVWSLTLTVTVFVWVSLLVVLGSFMVLTQQVVGLKAQAQKNAQFSVQRQKIEVEAQTINSVSSDILKIKNSTVYPEIILNAIFAAKPAGIGLTTFDIDLDKGDVILKGVSADRGSLVTFKENLEKTEGFGSINIPISSFEEVSNLTFITSLKYTPIGSEDKK